MTDGVFHPRFAEARLAEALTDAPAVLLHGPRQCGKTTLARAAGDVRGFVHLSFDDAVTLDAAQAAPAGFVADLPERTILDEVQRCPALFPALKTAIDRRRTTGRLAAATVTTADFRGLRKLRDAVGTRCTCGVVLYDGETAGFGDGKFAVPVRALRETV